MDLNLLRWTILAFIVCGIYGNQPKKIIGFATSVCSSLYQVALFHGNPATKKIVNYCGGAILDKTHILTAAHCVNGSAVSQTWIAAGCIDMLDENKTYTPVTKIDIHPHFNIELIGTRAFKINDIAVLTINPPLDFDDSITSVKLPTADVKPHQTGEIAGWGFRLCDTPSPSRFLVKTKLKILYPAKCGRPIPQTQFCAMDLREKSTCGSGDSGGPFVVNNNVVGIGISGFNNPHRPTFYTNIFFYLDFIGNILSAPTKYRSDMVISENDIMPPSNKIRKKPDELS